MLIIEFREFWECEAQIEGSLTKIHIQRRDTEAGMLVAYHLGGLARWHIMWLGLLGWENGTACRGEKPEFT